MYRIKLCVDLHLLVIETVGLKCVMTYLDLVPSMLKQIGRLGWPGGLL